ncbi:GLIPR1-like protein 1 [Notamacropus eugenii]|uniref:GLIPR1-like protein 1 n=1 Tax=Notamacropus eugenii TaxID=9315 RepID=UPI003B66CCF7
MKLNHRFPWLWALILAFMVTQSYPQTPTITDPKFIEDCVNIHNEMRSKIRLAAGNMRYMTWDPALAKTARAWVKKCVFQHNIHIGHKYQCHPVFKTVGENMWMGTYTKHVPRNATTEWFSEVDHYELGFRKCYRRYCGHFTQVAWAASYKIGCALKMCPNLGKHIAMFVCNYSPAGNIVGEAPYTKAYYCALCEEGDTCENNLCRNPLRDKVESYPYWNPRWEVPRRMTCNPFCQMCVSVRLVLLALAIPGILLLQKKYPNMHLMT